MNRQRSDLLEARRVIEESVVFKLLKAGVSVIAVAVEHSWVASLIARSAPSFRPLPARLRIRVIGLLIAVAAMTHLALLRLVPARLAPAVPTWLWVGVAAAAAIVVLSISLHGSGLD